MERNGNGHCDELSHEIRSPLSKSLEGLADGGSENRTQLPATSIVIPAYNEEHALGPVVQEIATVLSELGIEYEIIIVDDGCADNTMKAAEELGVTVLRHGSKRGYGAALKTGILAA